MSRRRRTTTLERAGLWLVGGCLVALVVSTAYRFGPELKPPAPPPPAPLETVATLRVEVQNGCGVRGAARAAASVLRQLGIDVVEVSNAPTQQLPETVVLDRTGAAAAQAEWVAAALGAPHVLTQRRDGAPAALTVVVGYDSGRWDGPAAIGGS